MELYGSYMQSGQDRWYSGVLTSPCNPVWYHTLTCAYLYKQAVNKYKCCFFLNSLCLVLKYMDLLYYLDHFWKDT